MPDLRNPPGTFDVLPTESDRWERLLVAFATSVGRGGYGLLLTPTFEDVNVFKRVGESTDVVRKEMYDFEDKGGRRIALRPEMTASAARAFIQHHPATPWKCWYAGSNFRYERSQAGRYREFHQLGIEAFGSPDPDLDVEVVALGWEYYRTVGIERIELLLNSLGDETCRPAYRELLLQYFRDHLQTLCSEHQTRLEDNPLRVLDCKKPECRAVVAGAPRQIDHLCDACATHFARVQEGLDELSIRYTISPLLVRGLDYYTRTTFEYAGLGLESSQNALGGGGRYDGLVSAMGGPATPAVGFALGMERILMAIDAEHAGRPVRGSCDVFLVDFAGGRTALELTARFRAAGVRADRAYDQKSAKAQFKAADRSGARFAVIVGPDELRNGTVGLKDLGGGSSQETVNRDEAVGEVGRRLTCG